MRDDRLYLSDILEAIANVHEFVGTMDEADFLQSKLVQSAVLQQIIVIGEAATRISMTTKSLDTTIPWSSITGFRNIAVHAYFSVDWDIVWNTATSDLVTLEKPIKELLKNWSQ